MKPRRNGPRFFKLCVLLLLNIGGTQADVSDLTQSEVDWMDGRITRKRSKMRKHPSAQTVCYKLWPETFRLLKHFRSTDSTLAIVNEDGLPLRSAREEKGKLKKSDAIKNLLFRLREKLNWPDGKLLKSLRKTGATLLKAQGADIELRELYLGHAPATIREIHYEQDSPEFQARFDAAIVKLGAAFGQ